MRSVCLPKTTILNATRLKKEVRCRSRRGGSPRPHYPLFSYFFLFFGRWAKHGCMQPVPTFVSHKQINFGRCFWCLIRRVIVSQQCGISHNYKAELTSIPILNLTSNKKHSHDSREIGNYFGAISLDSWPSFFQYLHISKNTTIPFYIHIIPSSRYSEFKIKVILFNNKHCERAYEVCPNLRRPVQKPRKIWYWLNQVIIRYFGHTSQRAPPLIKWAAGQCMFVLLFAHFFHYFISFLPPPTHPRSRLCLRFFIIRYLFYRPLHFQRMGWVPRANGRAERRGSNA